MGSGRESKGSSRKEASTLYFPHFCYYLRHTNIFSLKIPKKESKVNLSYNKKY